MSTACYIERKSCWVKYLTCCQQGCCPLGGAEERSCTCTLDSRWGNGLLTWGRGSHPMRGWRKRTGSLLGCVGGGLGLAPKAACQTESLQGILRLVCLWNLLKGDVFSMILPSPGLHKHLVWRRLHYSWACLLWCLVFLHLGYCKVWLSMELPDELPSLYYCYCSFVCGCLLCTAADVNISVKYQLRQAKAQS